MFQHISVSLPTWILDRDHTTWADQRRLCGRRQQSTYADHTTRLLSCVRYYGYNRMVATTWKIVWLYRSHPTADPVLHLWPLTVCKVRWLSFQDNYMQVRRAIRVSSRPSLIFTVRSTGRQHNQVVQHHVFPVCCRHSTLPDAGWWQPTVSDGRLFQRRSPLVHSKWAGSQSSQIWSDRRGYWG